ncbi:MAG: sugar transferase [Candidatus Omnitrophica bacterium]|nr:sugar transferase [Candidatus Omnitrophota bacterium]
MAKRIFDIIFSLVVLFFSIPIFIVVAFAIKLDSPGPVIFKQRRVGKNGIPFTILKFRTMRTQAGRLITSAGDARISKTGRLLRRTNFDELPQFINIVKGEMSVVGPRPEIPEIVACYAPWQKEILRFKPGFTSYATMKFLNEEKLLEKKNLMEFYLKEVLPQKIKYDLEYFASNRTLINDIAILLKTVGGTFDE